MGRVIDPHQDLTVEQFLALEETSSVRHEYVDGMVHALTGASARHDRVVVNLIGHLWNAARGSSCVIHSSDMMLRVAEKLFYYPDVTVVCDSADAGERFKTRPCLVVEVLSPSTAVIDRREKLMAYRQIQSLRAYLIIHPDELWIERHVRNDSGVWQQAVLYREGVIHLPCVDIDLSLQEIFEGLEEPLGA